jgi:hypothetical protein
MLFISTGVRARALEPSVFAGTRDESASLLSPSNFRGWAYSGAVHPESGDAEREIQERGAIASFNRTKVVELESDLKSVPTPDGRTAYDWVVEFLDSGDHIATLLDARSKVEADEPGVELALDRARALGLVTKARALVGEEAAKSAKLPKNAEAIVFGYFDTLAAFRSTVKNDDQEPPPPAAPAPATPSGG